MACSKTLRPVTTTLVTTTTTSAFEPLTEWMPSTGITDLDFAVTLLSLDGDAAAEVIPAVQLAAVRSDAPDSPGAITGSWVSTANTHHLSDTLSAGSKFLIRLGLAYKLKAGESGVAIVQAKLSPAVQQCGRILPGKEIDVSPFMTVTDGAHFPISGWEPTVGLSKIKAAFLVMDNSNTDLTSSASSRTTSACDDPAEPNSWQAAEAWANPASGNSERNTGEVSVPAGANLASHHLVQLGVGVRAKTAGTNPRATIRVVGALKY
jgi:hypothetical protein